MSRTYWVYILANRSRSLYVGVTNELQRRIVEHRERLVPGFAALYNVDRLVHCEPFADIRDAIAREKESRAGAAKRKSGLSSARIRLGKILRRSLHR